ncbi:MAG: hypothetical protein ACOYXC_04890 [Candidatus Rifleibacteriota bacterium]
MKSGICFTGTGPILVLTTYDSFTDAELLKKFESKGIKKFIVYEVAIDMVKQKYGAHYDVVLEDLKQENDLRVLDYDGHHVFYQFPLTELGQPVIYDNTY